MVQQELVFKWIQLSSKVKKINLFYILNSSVNANFKNVPQEIIATLLPQTTFQISTFKIHMANK
jgi:hypothetical protein